MLKAVPLGEWAPDLAPSNNKSLSEAKNVYPIANGYAPVRGFQAATAELGAAVVGGGSFVSSTGVSTLLAATAAKLRKYSGSWSDVLVVATAARWYFSQYGDNIIYANGEQLGSYDLIAGTAAVIATAPANAIDVATVKDVVMCLTDDSQAAWSDINDSTNWTTGQSDTQPLLDGGPGVRIVGGEYGVILQKRAIRRVAYTGVQDLWFQFDVISPEIGCMAAGSVANTGRLIFFLSERGFEMCDGENVYPIADEKFNRWFFATYSRADIANIWSAIDPRNSIVMWAMPGGAAILYNWVLKRAATLDLDVAALLTGQTTSVSIDAVDALYGNLDTVPLSLDDASLAGGNPALYVVNSSAVFGTLTGPNLEADITQDNVELSPGRRSRLRSLRLVSDTLSASCQINSKMRAGDAENLVSSASMRTNGKLPIRANGRYFDNRITIPAAETWSYIQACEYEFEIGDGR